jgi:hypothetical protein
MEVKYPPQEFAKKAFETQTIFVQKNLETSFQCVQLTNSPKKKGLNPKFQHSMIEKPHFSTCFRG